MITSKHRFYTRTLAGLYLDQGYLAEAEEAFRALLERDPDCPECREALADIARRKTEVRDDRDLADLVRTWAELLRREKGKGHGNG